MSSPRLERGALYDRLDVSCRNSLISGQCNCVFPGLASLRIRKLKQWSDLRFVSRHDSRWSDAIHYACSGNEAVSVAPCHIPTLAAIALKIRILDSINL